MFLCTTKSKEWETICCTFSKPKTAKESTRLSLAMSSTHDHPSAEVSEVPFEQDMMLYEAYSSDESMVETRSTDSTTAGPVMLVTLTARVMTVMQTAPVMTVTLTAPVMTVTLTAPVMTVMQSSLMNPVMMCWLLQLTHLNFPMKSQSP